MEHQAPPKPARKPGQIALVSILVLLAAALVFLANSFHYYRAIGSAMLPTIAEGDMMICQKVKAPQPGDIVVFQVPSFMSETMVKRVIATEGQHVVIDYKNSCVLVDGVPLEEPYINEAMRDPGRDTMRVLDITVPEGSVYILGDNRNNSVDSRDERLGCISVSDIKGKVLWVLKKSGKQ